MREWIVETAIKIYTVLLPVAWIALATVLFVLLPLAAWRKTRRAAGVGLLVTSYIFGATTWFLSAAVAFGSFGWLGLIIGLLVMGVGVVPIAIVGAFFKLRHRRSRCFIVCDVGDHLRGQDRWRVLLGTG